MKPEQLKSPFSWKDRKVHIYDRVWYVPEYCMHYDAFSFPGWEHPDLFGNQNPVHIEYCSGNGSWIAERALADPNNNWVAIEKKFPRVQKVWSKIKNLNLNNLIVVCGEGYNITKRYFPSESISSVYINFPDPWPKKRHAKHRIIQPLFLQEAHRILKDNSLFTFVTDDASYSEWTIESMEKEVGFKNCHTTPYYITEHHEYGTSYFEELWREKGKIIRYHQFCRL